ncbi:hypothetical protein [Undibacterium sp. RuRC25W]|uniref:hypothetical protein n=1 Tax=Undibacterium sp. RuRC25W TaxID=3413047 RepID=UPI003BF2ABD1
MRILEGIWVPVTPPFRRQEVDRIAIQKLALGLYRSGTNDIVLGGTTGEADEILRIVFQ